MAKTIFGRVYSDDALTLLVWMDKPAPNKSEPTVVVKLGNEQYNYNGLTVTWPNH